MLTIKHLKHKKTSYIRIRISFFAFNTHFCLSFQASLAFCSKWRHLVDTRGIARAALLKLNTNRNFIFGQLLNKRVSYEVRRMESVYTQGIWLAESLQQKTIDHQKLWLIVTQIGDPKAAFLLVFPLTYFISKRTGIAVLWVAAISEWLNLVFKW